MMTSIGIKFGWIQGVLVCIKFGWLQGVLVCIKFGWIQGVLVCRCRNTLKLNSEPTEKKQHALAYDI